MKNFINSSIPILIDDGVEYSHVDLRKNYLPNLSFDFNEEDSDPSPRNSFEWFYDFEIGILFGVFFDWYNRKTYKDMKKRI